MCAFVATWRRAASNQLIVLYLTSHAKCTITNDLAVWSVLNTVQSTSLHNVSSLVAVISILVLLNVDGIVRFPPLRLQDVANNAVERRMVIVN